MMNTKDWKKHSLKRRRIFQKKVRLDTILQEKGNIHLYEKLGYHQTGRAIFAGIEYE